ncbi:hypothetical protein BJ165DRAFT_1532056 [Panaeolus papilionaceus]|nr:hypothetical protein BJ165DRAFT_1532056 [Panaeolus papilionaceus]
MDLSEEQRRRGEHLFCDEVQRRIEQSRAQRRMQCEKAMRAAGPAEQTRLEEEYLTKEKRIEEEEEEKRLAKKKRLAEEEEAREWEAARREDPEVESRHSELGELEVIIEEGEDEDSEEMKAARQAEEHRTKAKVNTNEFEVEAEREREKRGGRLTSQFACFVLDAVTWRMEMSRTEATRRTEERERERDRQKRMRQREWLRGIRRNKETRQRDEAKVHLDPEEKTRLGEGTKIRPSVEEQPGAERRGEQPLEHSNEMEQARSSIITSTSANNSSDEIGEHIAMLHMKEEEGEGLGAREGQKVQEDDEAEEQQQAQKTMTNLKFWETKTSRQTKKAKKIK